MSIRTLLGCLLALVAAFVPGAAAAQAAPAATARPEPNVRRTVIEDDGARIEELKVRGQLQRITVQPKTAGVRSYEILTSDGSRDLSENAVPTRGATGKRVWNVLNF